MKAVSMRAALLALLAGLLPASAGANPSPSGEQLPPNAAAPFVLVIDDSVDQPRLVIPRRLVEPAASCEKESQTPAAGLRSPLIPAVLGVMALAFAGLWLVRFRAAGGKSLSLALGIIGVVALAGLVWASTPAAPAEQPLQPTRVVPRTLPATRPLATPPLITRPVPTRPIGTPAGTSPTRPAPTRPAGTRVPATPVKPIDDEVRKRLPTFPFADQAVVEIVATGDAIQLIVNRRHLQQLAEKGQ